ncbi:hypothetical protein M0805_007099 [Coniferiporia weirii]|nr:hypothetical protein M0805_007099 [Coniferiporia weirii]
MSLSENDNAIVPFGEEFDPKLVHIKAIEINFKDNRPRYPIYVVFKRGGEHPFSLKSPQFEKDGPVRWDLEELQHIPVTTDFSIFVQEVHTFKIKKLSGSFKVTSKEIVGLDNFSNTDKKGKVQLKLTCVSASPVSTMNNIRAIIKATLTVPKTEAFTKLLVEEAQVMLERKKVFLESLGKSAEVLAAVMKFTDLASDVHPAAKAAVIAVNALYERCQLQQECHDMAVELMKDLVSFLPYTKDVPQGFVEDGRTKRMIRQMLELFCQVSRLIIEYSSEGVLGDFLSSHRDRIDTSKDDLKRMKEAYGWYIKMEVWRSITRIERYVVDTLIQRLRPAKRSFYNADRVCPEGEWVSVLGWVKEWADSDSGVFWLRDEMGSGKSSIAHSVAHMFEKEGRLAGCFFCKKNDKECRNPLMIIPTLAYHFSKLYEAYHLHILSVLRGEHELKLFQSLQWQFELLIKGPLNALSLVPPRPLIIVIGALDECRDSQNSTVQLAGVFLQLVAAIPWLKVVVSSRSLPGLHQTFIQSAMRCQTLDIDSEVDHDAIIRVLLDTSTGGRVAEVDQIYTILVQNAIKIVGNAQAFWTVLGIIDCTSKTRPLSENEIVQFLSFAGQGSIDLKTLNAVIDALQAVLYRDISRSDAICICHSSFLDFIHVQTGSQTFWTGSAHADTIMARGCLQVLTSELKFNLCGLESSHVTNNSILDLKNRVSECISQKLQYSCLYWMKHLASSALEITEQSLQDLLNGFLHSPRALYWIECLSNMRELNSGVDMLKQCTEYFKKSSKAFAICTELHELVSTCYSAISTSTPHLYISALSWAPANGLIVKQIYQYFSNQSLAGSVREAHIVNAVRRSLPGHSGSVVSVAYSPDGRHIVSGSSDRTLRVWDAHTAVGLTGYLSEVNSVAYCPDGRYIVSGSDTMTLRIWDTQTGKPVGEPLRGHKGYVQSVAYSPDGRHIVSGSDDRTLRIWDAHTGKPVGEPLTDHLSCVHSVAYSPDGRHIVSGSGDFTLRIWNAHTGKPVGEPLTGHSSLVQSVAYSPDGRHIVSGSNDNTLGVK